jgi:uncharacterized membrane protein YjdF
MKRFSLAAFWIVLVFIANVIALYFDIYHQLPWLDIPMHFFGGYTVALFGIALYAWIRGRVEIRAKNRQHSKIAILLLEMLFVIGFVMIVSVVWEIWEFFMDQFATAFVNRFGATQPGIADTMDDLLNDGVGAMTAKLICERSRFLMSRSMTFRRTSFWLVFSMFAVLS